MRLDSESLWAESRSCGRNVKVSLSELDSFGSWKLERPPDEVLENPGSEENNVHEYGSFNSFSLLRLQVFCCQSQYGYCRCSLS